MIDITFLSQFIDLTIMIAIVGVVQMIKRADKKAGERNLLYMLVFVGICLGVSVFLSMSENAFAPSFIIGLGSTMIRFVKYAGIGTVFYKLIAKYIDGKNGDEK